MSKDKVFKTIKEIFIIVIGTFVLAMGLKVFLIPFNITVGGFSGLAIVLSHLMEMAFNIRITIGVVMLAINVPIFLFALKRNGVKFVVYSFLGTILSSIFIDFINFSFNIDDVFLALVYGSILIGLGLGLVIRIGASTGGSDMLAVILTNKFKKLSIGKVIICVDLIVVLISMLSFSFQSGLYSIIGIIITGKVIDIFVTGFTEQVSYYIISNKYNDISKEIMDKLSLNVTLINGLNTLNTENRKVLFVIVNKRKIAILKELVSEIDDEAVYFSVNIHESSLKIETKGYLKKNK